MKLFIIQCKNVSFIFLIFLLVMACSKDDGSNSNDDSNKLDSFLGSYSVENSHETGLHQVFDSMGSTIGQEVRMSTFSDSLLTITKQDNDTLIVNGLKKSWDGTHRQEVKAVLESDSLIIKYELPTYGARNNFIKGKIWFRNDSLILDYRWNTSDIWSTGALPIYGKVIGKGIRK